MSRPCRYRDAPMACRDDGRVVLRSLAGRVPLLTLQATRPPGKLAAYVRYILRNDRTPVLVCQRDTVQVWDRPFRQAGSVTEAIRAEITAERVVLARLRDPSNGYFRIGKISRLRSRNDRTRGLSSVHRHIRRRRECGSLRAALAAARCRWSGNASVLTYRGLAVQSGGYGDVGATPVWSDGSLLGNYLLQRPPQSAACCSSWANWVRYSSA